jgi:AraC family transcriptional regulator, transcriptional activator of the genes for pyochelin and ferripyochelin receptors
MSFVLRALTMTRAIPRASSVNTLTAANVEEFFEQAQQQNEPVFQSTEWGMRVNLPKKLGDGGDSVIQLREGLTLHVRSAKLWQTMEIEQQHESIFPLTAKFYLSGSSRVQTQGVTDIQPDYEEVAGCNYLYCLPDLTEIEAWPASELIQVVMVCASIDYFRGFNLPCKAVPKPLQDLLECNSAQRFHQSLGTTTPEMYQLLQQILYCPYQGLTQHLYLESKALELLALQFAQWTEDDLPSEQIPWRTEDIERLHHAKEILIQHSTKPPSLVELARQAGLNDRKLKQGFRHLFGTTVFGYLQDYRMHQAKQLLHDADLTIASVAATVGYKNPEAFSTAFRRKFAVSPKAYQLGRYS